MEEEKAAAYYEELTRKGEGAARFKQGLGFSSSSVSDNAPPSKGSALSSSSSFLSSFVRASSPSQLQKQSHLESIQNKLKKKPTSTSEQQQQQHHKHSRVSEKSDGDRERHSRRRSRSRERHRDRDRDRDRDRKRRRSVSPRERRRAEKSRSDDRDRDRVGKANKERNGGVDFSKLIQGYDTMTPAERVKAKMKLQLTETAEKDETKGMGSGWERFEFDKDAPLDDEEIEAAEDDAALVKHIGQSFRFSAVETRREEQIKAAHDEAMFGASSLPPSGSPESEPEMEDNKKESNENGTVASLLSEKVLAKQQGSWRDRARKA